jgi:inosine/xanthosine triphosphate pyrophosphatase family protein
MSLLFVTPNSWNADEGQRLLAGLKVTSSRFGLPKGDGTDLEDIARFRARAAWDHFQQPLFVENTALALEGQPPLTGKRFKQLHRELGDATVPAGTESTREQRDAAFCARFGGTHGETRVVVALITAADHLTLFTGRGEGQVVTSPRGEGGYGWDRVWQPDGYTQTVSELGTSRFLINMRQRPFLELAAHVRGDGTPGYFEAHVTVKPCDMTAFAKSCERLGVKCLHIVMPEKTAQAEQPMTGSYHLGTLTQAREEVLELARALVRDGFEVTRMKIEATGRAFGAPESDDTASALPRDVYFEHHATVLLPDGFDEQLLHARCNAHGGYVSKNLRKHTPERFITIRSYQVGRVTADARFEAVLDELRTLGLTLKNRAREFTVFDSAPHIDAGWMA